MFQARRLQAAGVVGSIVVDNVPGSAASTSPMFAMSGDGTDDVDIPVVFLFSQDAWQLLQALAKDPAMIVTLSGNKSGNYRLHWKSLVYFLITISFMH